MYTLANLTVLLLCYPILPLEYISFAILKISIVSWVVRCKQWVISRIKPRFFNRCSCRPNGVTCCIIPTYRIIRFIFSKLTPALDVHHFVNLGYIQPTPSVVCNQEGLILFFRISDIVFRCKVISTPATAVQRRVNGALITQLPRKVRPML